MKRLKTKEKQEVAERRASGMSRRGKDREEFVCGIAYCDFAKIKEAKRSDARVWKLLTAAAGNTMPEQDVHIFGLLVV